MPKAYPLEFRRDVIAVASRKEAPLRQIAKDFGISGIDSVRSALKALDIVRDQRRTPAVPGG